MRARSWYDASMRERAPFPALGGPPDSVNQHFHDAYDAARAGAAEDGPVLVVLADSLIVFRGEGRSEVTFTPRLFHVVKSVAHAPIALFAALHRRGREPLDAATRARLESLRAELTRTREGLDARVEPGLVQNLCDLCDASIAFADHVLEAGETSAKELGAFADAAGPSLLSATDDATRLQLAALHTHVTEQVAQMTAAERRAFQVVVTGDHQARARSLAMQYFEKLLREPPGAEHRVTYAEAITDANLARALVGTRRLDRAIAAAFFKDPRRLQRDVLGDAVTQRLRSFELDPVT